MAKPAFTSFPSNVPEKLIKAYFQAGCNGRQLSRLLKVNDYYVSKALRGVEPANLDIRVKLYFPRHPHKPRPPLPEELRRTKKAIRSMVKATKRALRRYFS